MIGQHVGHHCTQVKTIRHESPYKKLRGRYDEECCVVYIPQMYYKIRTAGHTNRDKTNPLMNIGPYKKETKTQ